MIIETDVPGRILVRHHDVVVLEYVFEPDGPVMESRRPYALLSSVDGRTVTDYRPDDHPWHKGLSLALANVGEHNFWGGPTYLRDEGYRQLPNNGSQVHRGFTRVGPESAAGAIGFDEVLDWVAESGETILTETRRVTARLLEPSWAEWMLTWSSTLRNVSPQGLVFSSPSARGRESAGYSGLFWRGPDSFVGGEIESPEGPVGEGARGRPAPWLAYRAPNDDLGVLVVDASPTAPNPWFARSEHLAGLCATPNYAVETTLAPGAALGFGAVLAIGGREIAHSALPAASLLASTLCSDDGAESTDTKEIR